MTYRERLLEKCKIVERLLRNKSQLIYQREKARGKTVSGPFSIRSYETGYRESHAQALVVITALLDECEKLACTLERAKEVIDFCYMNQPENKHQIEIKTVLSAHATAMEKLCGEGE